MEAETNRLRLNLFFISKRVNCIVNLSKREVKEHE